MDEFIEIILESNKGLKEVSDKIDALLNQLKTSNMHLFKMLDEMEGRFDVTGEFDSLEICRDYIDAALYCMNYFNRINNRIRQAQDWYNSQII